MKRWLLILSIFCGLLFVTASPAHAATTITYVDYGGGIGQTSNYYYSPGHWDTWAYDTNGRPQGREVFQSDCNLVGYIYDVNYRTYVIFASNTVRSVGTNCTFAIQTDGNLVIYQAGHGAIWASNSNRGTQYGYQHRIWSSGSFDVLWYHPGGTIVWTKP